MLGRGLQYSVNPAGLPPHFSQQSMKLNILLTAGPLFSKNAIKHRVEYVKMLYAGFVCKTTTPFFLDLTIFVVEPDCCGME